jgi:hypothetical protein
MMKPGPGSEALWGAVERELRRFVEAYERLPEWLWSPETVKFVRAVRPKLERLAGAERARREFMETIRPPGRRD